ncbi:MAG: AMP-binding protein [Planctomycetota bacterium]
MHLLEESPPTTLPDLLRRACAPAHAKTIGLLDGRGRRGEPRPWADFLRDAEDAAGRLVALGVEPGEPVLLGLGTGFEFLELWFGAVLAGALPVAAAPPGGMGANDLVLRRLAAVFERLGGRRVVAAPALAETARAQGLDAFADAIVDPSDVAALAPRPISDAPRDPDDVAFLQLTSGSTGVPRAVRISHAGAAHNPRAMIAAVAACDRRLAAGLREGRASCVSWLPLHHDMGLVGLLLSSLAVGAELWLSAPRTFLGRPQTWLQNLGAAELTVSAAPNFAYQTCVERLEAPGLAGVDLSGWRAALCGAEMIRPETLHAFAERFGSLGFDATAFRPCYGLAEGTLAVTFDTRGEGLRTAPVPAGGAHDAAGPRETACLGAPVLDTEVAVVAPDGSPVPEGAVGEVRVKGPGVFLGYHNDPEETAAALGGGWLRTGDLGFLRAGELYLAGRTKDILLVNGQNLMPHELEWLAESASGGGGVTRAGAFSTVPAGADASAAEGEKAVVVIETGETDAAVLGKIEREVRVDVGRALGIPLADCVFVRRGRLPKTTSGKVQRRELARRYATGELERLESEMSE